MQSSIITTKVGLPNVYTLKVSQMELFTLDIIIFVPTQIFFKVLTLIFDSNFLKIYQRHYQFIKDILSNKSNLHRARGITSKRVTRGWAHVRGLAPGQNIFEETSQRWRAVDDPVSDLTDPVFEPQTSRADSNVLTTQLTGRFFPTPLRRNP